MQFVARTKRVPVSPFKLRTLVNVIRGKDVQYALGWLATYPVQRTVPIKKMIESAVANAKHLKNVEPQELVIREIRVDQGPMFRYVKPGAMGRANVLRRRFSHMSVVLETKTKEA